MYRSGWFTHKMFSGWFAFRIALIGVESFSQLPHAGSDHCSSEFSPHVRTSDVLMEFFLFSVNQDLKRIKASSHMCQVLTVVSACTYESFIDFGTFVLGLVRMIACRNQLFSFRSRHNESMYDSAYPFQISYQREHV